MKRILVFNDCMQMGGTEKLLIDLLDHLLVREYHVTLLLPQKSDKDILLSQLSTAIEVKYIFSENTSYTKRKSAETLLIFSPSLFNRFWKIHLDSFDTIICFKDSSFAPIFAEANAKKILWIHNILFRRKYEVRSIKERIAVALNKMQLNNMYKAYKKYDSIVCVSNACKNEFIDIVYEKETPLSKIRMIHNGVDLNRIITSSKEYEVTLANETTNFVLVTRNTPEKRTDRIIVAAQRLLEGGYNFHINIIGNVDTPELKQMIQDSSLTEVISLLGQIKNPLPYIAKSDWLLCTSERESFGLTLVEAMILDTPVITTDCGGPSDIINKGEYGILVENSTEGVYQGIRTVLDTPSLAQQYKTAQKKATESFDYEVWHKQIDTLLDL